MSRHVALGSSFASGPGLPPGAAYPHLVAARLGLELTDVSRSGATTAHLLRESQDGRPPQVEALDGSESLVTVTIAGNDLAMSRRTMTAAMPRWLRRLPVVRSRVAATLGAVVGEPELAEVTASLRAVLRTVRERSPDARVVLVDYLTVLPPEGRPAPPLEKVDADSVRAIAAGLRTATAAAAAAEGCLLVGAAHASLEHHAWSAQPWTSGAAWPPLPGRPLAFHPNLAGMRAVAELVVRALEDEQT